MIYYEQELDKMIVYRNLSHSFYIQYQFQLLVDYISYAHSRYHFQKVGQKASVETS